jgi:hypothetical protein
VSFSTSGEAKQFLVSRIVQEAKRRQRLFDCIVQRVIR